MHMAGRHAVGSWCWEIETDRCFVDAFTAGLFGVDFHDAKAGLPVRTYTSSIHPDERDRVERRLEEMAASGDTFLESYRVIGFGGLMHRVAVAGQCYKLHGRPHLFTGTLELQQSADTLSSLVSAAVSEARRQRQDRVSYILEIAMQEMRLQRATPTPRRLRALSN